MIFILLTIIVILISFIIYLNFQFYNEKKIFAIKLEILQNSIVMLNDKQAVQSDQIKLTEAFEQNLKSRNTTLSKDIFGLNFELFAILSKNNLLKK